MESYEEILSRMQDEFTSLAGFMPEEASDIGVRLKVLAGEIFSLEANLEWLKNQMFTKTATGECLDLHAEERGLERKEAKKSKGTLTFSRESALDYDVEIPQGTVCSLSGTEGIRYITTEAGTLTAGNLEVEVPAESELGGKNKNTGQETIVVMVTPPVGITSVTNEVAFTGGTDAESDEVLKERILESYKNISNGSNKAFYKEEVLKYDGIHSASVIPTARGTGTVDIYVAGKGSVASESLISKIQNDISNLRELNLDVQIKSPTLVEVDVMMSITLKPGYVLSEVRTECQKVINEFFENLSIGEQVIFAAIGQKVFEVEGVKNYSFNEGSDIDQLIDDDELAVIGTLSISES